MATLVSQVQWIILFLSFFVLAFQLSQTWSPVARLAWQYVLLLTSLSLYSPFCVSSLFVPLQSTNTFSYEHYCSTIVTLIVTILTLHLAGQVNSFNFYLNKQTPQLIQNSSCLHIRLFLPLQGFSIIYYTQQ